MEMDAALGLVDKIDCIMAGRIYGEAVDPDVFKSLDDPDINRHELEEIGRRIPPEIYLRLTAMANSVYFGSLRYGDVSSFYEVVNRLGMQKTKALIIALTNYHQGRHDPEIETLFAKSFATSVMAQVLAVQTGFRDDAVAKAELCGLFLDVGKRAMILYKRLYAPDNEELDEEFINSYHPYLGEKIVARSGLPDYMKTVILARAVIMEEHQVSLIGIVYLAYHMVNESFQRHGNRLVIKCQTPRPATDITRTLEAIIADRFRAVGLEKYLHIIRVPRLYDIP
jgi:HD-like signal output (HDOD) protein